MSARSLLLLVLAGLGLLLVAAKPDARSPLVYPEQQLPLNFTHKKHLEAGVGCVVCHGTVNGSERTADRNIPNHSTCGLCHRMELPNAAEMWPKAACSTCHAGYEGGSPADLQPNFLPKPDLANPPAPVVIEPARLRFSHKVHIDQGVECTTCHVGIEEAELATVDHLPDMPLCLTCHNDREAPAACTTCHLPGDASAVRTELAGAGPLMPSGRFRPDDHGDPMWLRGHEAAARSDLPSCESCHEPQACLDCHDGVAKVRELHPADWVMTHGLEAMRKTLNCQGCHDPQAFCRDCHAQAEVRFDLFPGPKSDAENKLQFHPTNWGRSFADEVTGEHHSHQARRSLEACVACHAPADCTSCHIFVNPHGDKYAEPGNWNFGQGEGTVCLECHAPGSAELRGVLR